MDRCIALDRYIVAKQQLNEIWLLFHEWYDSKTPELKRYALKKHANIVKQTPKLTKRALYSEMKKKRAYVNLARQRYEDEKRFNALTDIFYDRTHVDLEFARRTIYSYLRATNHQG